MGATLKRRDCIRIEFAVGIADVCTILLYVFKAVFSGGVNGSFPRGVDAMYPLH